MFYFDPIYFVALAPAILFSIWAQFKVKSTYAKANKIVPASGMSGVDAAKAILNAEGISNVKIEITQGRLSDHYDPRTKTLRLSEEVYNGRTLAAVGIAAHEVGHAIQDAQKYGMLVLRNAVVPVASIGSNLSWGLLFIGFLLNSMNLILVGIGLFSSVVIFQIINLPVEYDASSRAKELVISRGLVSPQEQKEIAKVLDAAALTYVAATVTAVLTLLYYLYRSGLIGGNRN
jgi:Zn-dependent membrane protease YugP